MLGRRMTAPDNEFVESPSGIGLVATELSEAELNTISTSIGALPAEHQVLSRLLVSSWADLTASERTAGLLLLAELLAVATGDLADHD